MPEFQLVEQPDTLAAELVRLDRVGVDTEFMREKTFFAELCLVQLATAGHIYCVDPLTAASKADFWGALLDTPWVLHSGRQDIEVVYQTAGRMPGRIFDTQIAAGMLGHPPQMGYAHLVKALFNVEIDKSHTRADWSKRPLNQACLQYAAEDVEYLLAACDALSESLDRIGRLAWAEEDSARLLDAALYDADPEAAIERLKGARNLRGRSRAAAARLAAWREREALKANRPRQWILKDAVLIELAGRLPDNVAELERVADMPAGLVRRCGTTIIAAIAASGTDEHDYTPPRSPDESQKGLLKSMQNTVAACAADLGLAAETVAAKRDLIAIATDAGRDSRVLDGWRRKVIGEELLKLL
jgi:ribonuclease D